MSQQHTEEPIPVEPQEESSDSGMAECILLETELHPLPEGARAPAVLSDVVAWCQRAAAFMFVQSTSPDSAPKLTSWGEKTLRTLLLLLVEQSHQVTPSLALWMQAHLLPILFPNGTEDVHHELSYLLLRCLLAYSGMATTQVRCVEEPSATPASRKRAAATIAAASNPAAKRPSRGGGSRKR